MSDRIDIAPAEVQHAGDVVSTQVQEARAALIGPFDSARPAALGNPGFATGRN